WRPKHCPAAVDAVGPPTPMSIGAPQAPPLRGAASRRHASGVTELMYDSFTQTCSPGATIPQLAPRPAAAQVSEPSGWLTFASVIARGAPPPSLSSTYQQLAGSPARSTAALFLFKSSTQPLDPDMHSLTTIAGASRPRDTVAGASSPAAQAAPVRAATAATPARRLLFTEVRTSPDRPNSGHPPDYRTDCA